MICNFGTGLGIPAWCPTQEDGGRFCIDCAASFSAVVNFRALDRNTKERPTLERPQCSMAEIYDEYMVGFLNTKILDTYEGGPKSSVTIIILPQ